MSNLLTVISIVIHEQTPTNYMNIYDVLYFTENNILWINMYMEFKIKTWTISLLSDIKEKAAILNWLLQTKL